MIVSSVDIQNNFGKYLAMASEREILITQDGRTVARLVGITAQRPLISEQLRGIIPADVDEKALKDERLARQ